MSTPRTVRNLTITDPFRSPIVESDWDADDELEDSLFGDSLQDALAAIALVTRDYDIENQDSDFFDSDHEDLPSPTLYESASTATNSSKSSLRGVLNEDEEDEVFLNNGKRDGDNIKDVNVEDRGTYILTRTLIRPFQTRKPTALSFFSALVSPEPVKSLPRAFNLIHHRHSYSSETINPPSRPTSPFSFYSNNHSGGTGSLNSHTPPSSRPASPSSGIPDSLRVFPFLLNNPLFEEDIDHREETWAKQKLGLWNIEISVKVETEVTVESETESEFEPNSNLKLNPNPSVTTTTQTSISEEGQFGIYDPEGRGMLGPKDQLRRRVFSPMKRVQ